VTVLDDPELRDLLGERPELAAIADALAATQRRPRRRLARLAVAALLTAAVGVALLLLAPWAGRGPDVLDRALAAVGERPVVHAVVESSSPNSVVVDLATGAERERVSRTEFWFDAERSLLRTRLTTDGRQLTDAVSTPDHLYTDIGVFPQEGVTAQLDPALAGFATRYRRALEDGTAKVVGHQRIDGRNLTLIEIEIPGSEGARERVGVTDDDYRPFFFRYVQPDGQESPWLRVAVLESVDRDAATFAPPAQSPPRPTSGRASSSSDVAIGEAAAALGGSALWVGASVGGFSLAKARLTTSKIGWTDGRTTEGTAINLSYGAGRGRAGISIGEATAVAGAYVIGIDGVSGGDPLPPPGSIALRGIPGSGGTVSLWRGQLRVGSVYVALESSNRELLLAAVRALRPVPAGVAALP